MTFKEKRYAYSVDIVKVENGVEQVIGMINKEGRHWDAYIEGFGRVTDNGFAFTSKKKAKDAIINKHQELLHN